MGWKSAGLRALRWGLWILLAWVFVRGVFSFLPAPRAESAAAPQKNEARTTAEPAGLRAFPEMFAREYLTWQATGPEERAERLKPFLAAQLDRQAGWSGREGSGQGVTDTWVYSIKRLSDTRWQVVVAARVQPYQTGAAQAPATGPAQGPAPAASASAPAIATPGERKNLPERTLYLAIPVSATAAGGWVVYDYPALVAPPAAGEFAEPPYFGQVETDKGDQVKNLLTGFFKAYLEGSDVTYYLVPGAKLIPMRGWTFDSVGSVALLKDGTDHWAVAEVRATDGVTGARFLCRYTVKLAERDGRWYVQEIQQKGE